MVCLLGVSLHPLCFVLELAPHGSLAAVIEELSAEREARAQQQGSNVSAIRGSMLGREMSYKIAFQVNFRDISSFCFLSIFWLEHYTY